MIIRQKNVVNFQYLSDKNVAENVGNFGIFFEILVLETGFRLFRHRGALRSMLTSACKHAHHDNASILMLSRYNVPSSPS